MEGELLRFPEGLVGFRSLTRFVLLADTHASGLWWLQSIDAPEVAFALVHPGCADSDYQIELRPGDRAALELEEHQAPRVLVILNRVEPGGLTVNLQGPLVLNPARRLGRQLVLTSSRYAVRYPVKAAASGPMTSGRTVFRATA
jgi:flagellar assembly factor FliW